MDLPGPVTVAEATPALASVVRGWVTTSLGPVSVRGELPDGTALIATGGTWSALVAVAVQDGSTLTPALVLKNPIPLWQYTRALQLGRVDAATWAWLRRRFLIHNPGLEGVLRLLDEAVVALP